VNRRLLAIVILAAWVASLGWLVARERTARAAARLAVQVERVNPAQAHYIVRLGGRSVGSAVRTIDTLPYAVRVDQTLALDVVEGDSLRRLALRETASLSRGLVLRTFGLTLRGTTPAVTVAGEAIEGGPVRWSVQRGAAAAADVERGEAGDAAGVQVPVAVPLLLAFQGILDSGRTLRAPVVDPDGLRRVEADLVVGRDSTFVIPDSVAFDSATAGWQVVTTDTIVAWRVIAVMGARREEWWMDGQGVPAAIRLPSGLTFERTAVELVAAEDRARRQAGPAHATPALDSLRRNLFTRYRVR